MTIPTVLLDIGGLNSLCLHHKNCLPREKRFQPAVPDLYNVIVVVVVVVVVVGGGGGGGVDVVVVVGVVEGVVVGVVVVVAVVLCWGCWCCC